MGKDKVADKVIEEVSKGNTVNMIIQYLPIVIGLIALVVCYLLYKKIQSLNTVNDSVGKVEKQFSNFIKEQSEINSINAKRFNAIGSQINQINYVLQNMNSREVNNIESQMSPIREQELPQQKQTQQSPTINERELIPSSVVPNVFPVNNNNIEALPPPISTSIKKEPEIIQEPINKQEAVIKTKSKNKKVVTLSEDIQLEEESSDDE
jgi:hypothetical protein